RITSCDLARSKRSREGRRGPHQSEKHRNDHERPRGPDQRRDNLSKGASSDTRGWRWTRPAGPQSNCSPLQSLERTHVSMLAGTVAVAVLWPNCRSHSSLSAALDEVVQKHRSECEFATERRGET